MPTPNPPKSTTVVRGASLLIILQILSRAVTFVANQLLLRFLTAELLGVSTQLEVFYLSVLFFSRESLRVAVLRTDSPARTTTTKDADEGKQGRTGGAEGEKEGEGLGGSRRTRTDEVKTTQSAINLSYLSLLIGLPLTLIFGYTYLRSLSQGLITNTPNLIPSLYIYGISALLELAAEPAFVVLAIRLRFASRGRAESLGTLARCLLTLGTAFWAERKGKRLGVLPFAIGQLGYGVCVLVVYGRDAIEVARGEGFELLPRRVQDEKKADGGGRSGKENWEKEKESEYILGFFSRPTLNLARSMVVQSGVKYVLTQGDTLLVSVLSTPKAVGVYALVNNYGGLLARLVFQPVEESSRGYFSRLLASSRVQGTEARLQGVEASARHQMSNSESRKAKPGDDGKANKPQEHKEEQKEEPVATAYESLVSLLHLYLLFSLPIVSLGPTAAPPILSLVAGSRWDGEASQALSAYCLYIPLLALNGVTEAFVSSVASEEEVHAQSAFMVLCTAAFGLTGWVALRVLDMGARGLVLANAVNMGCRIAWSAWFVGAWFAKRGVARGPSKAMPAQLATASTVAAAAVVRRIVGADDGALLSLVKVAGCAVPFAAVLLYAERDFLMHCYRSYFG